MSTGLPTYQEPLLEIINGKPTGRMNWRWYQYFQEREPQVTEENIHSSTMAAAARAANAQAQAEFATMHRPPRQFVEVLESALMMQRPRQPINNFTFLADTAANLTNYTASAYPSAIYFETDTFVTRWSDGSAWTEFIFPALIKLLGSTSSFPALKRSGAILQVRLADDSAYSDLEVLDEAYDVTTWNGSVEVPTKNAIRDKVVALFPTDPPSGTYTPTLTSVANLDAVTAYQCQYVRIGNHVIVSGLLEADPTAGATTTQIGISLPIASNLGASEDLGGAGGTNAVAGESFAIYGDAANNRAQMDWISVSTSNHAITFIFSYEVI